MGNRTLFLLIAGLFIISVFAFNQMKVADPTEPTSSEDTLETVEAIEKVSQENDTPSVKKIAANQSARNHENHVAASTTARSSKVFRRPASANNDNDHIVQKTPEVQELKTFSIALEDKHWKIWEGVTAVPEHKFINKGQELAGRLSGYILVKGEDGLTLDDFNSTHPIVVYNERRQIPGVVTGILSVKIATGVDVNLVLDSYQLVSRDAFPQIRLYYVTSKNQPFNLPELFKSLQKDPLIEKVDVEILDRQYEEQ